MPRRGEKEREALLKVKVNKFGVVPIKVPIFGTATADWDVTIPADSEFDIVITLNGKDVASTGSQTFTLTHQTTFVLSAVIRDPDGDIGRILRQQSVAADTSDCQTKPFPASVVTEPLKNLADSAFTGAGNFSLKPGGSSVTPGTPASSTSMCRSQSMYPTGSTRTWISMFS